jgi:integrase
MRKGEILNVKWSDVHFRNRLIVVEGTKNDDRKNAHEQEIDRDP